MKVEIPKEILIRDYVEGKKTLAQIGREHGCTRDRVKTCLKHCGIVLKTQGKPKPHKLHFEPGQKFYFLTVIKQLPRQPGENIYRWLCQCDCGKQKAMIGTCLHKGTVKSCGCLLYKRGQDSFHWNGHGEIPLYFWKGVKDKARRRDIDFLITIEEAWELFLKQKRKCAITDLALEFPKTINHLGTASLDRIDSAKTYTIDNIQWVHKYTNSMKWSFDMEDFVWMCKLVTENPQNQKYLIDKSIDERFVNLWENGWSGQKSTSPKRLRAKISDEFYSHGIATKD